MSNPDLPRLREYSRREVYADLYGFDPIPSHGFMFSSDYSLPMQLGRVCQTRVAMTTFYYSDKGQELHREKPWGFTPNTLRNQMVSSGEAILEEIAKGTYIPPEHGGLVDIYRGFLGFAAMANWDDADGFLEVRVAYDNAIERLQRHVLERVVETTKSITRFRDTS